MKQWRERTDTVLLSELNLKELRSLNAFRLSLPAQDLEKASSAEVSQVSRKCSYTSLSTTQRQEIVALYKQGVMVQQIANQYGIHRTTIIRVVRQAGGEPRSSALSDEEVRRIVELYVRDRLAIGAIARLTRRSKATIHAVLKREGVAMRSPGRRQSSSSRSD